MRKKNNHKLFLIFALSVLLISLVVFFATKEKHIQTINHNMTVEVGSKPRFHLSSELNFGTVHPGGMSTKQMNITNPYNYNVNLRIKSEGNITDFISINYSQKIPPGETVEIDINAKIPVNTTLGNYSGTLIMEFYKRII